MNEMHTEIEMQGNKRKLKTAITVGVINREEDPKQVINFAINRQIPCDCKPDCDQWVSTARMVGVLFGEEAIALVDVLNEAIEERL